MYDDFKHRAAFFIVYIAEAHTIDGWQTESNESEGIRLTQHRSFAERQRAAALAAEKLALSIPMLVDGMDNAAFEAFSAWPERIYIVSASGKVEYRGGHGPYDFKPAEAREALIELLRGEAEAR